MYKNCLNHKRHKFLSKTQCAIYKYVLLHRHKTCYCNSPKHFRTSPFLLSALTGNASISITRFNTPTISNIPFGKESGLKISFHVLDKSKSQVYSVKVNFTTLPTESEITQQHKKIQEHEFSEACVSQLKIFKVSTLNVDADIGWNRLRDSAFFRYV